MITDTLRVSKERFERATGWALRPEGACLGEICIPLRNRPADSGSDSGGEIIDLASLAEDMGLPLIDDEPSGLRALGPHSVGGRTLATATAPSLELPDVDGSMFELASLRGQKVLLIAWASY